MLTATEQKKEGQLFLRVARCIPREVINRPRPFHSQIKRAMKAHLSGRGSPLGSRARRGSSRSTSDDGTRRATSDMSSDLKGRLRSLRS